MVRVIEQLRVCDLIRLETNFRFIINLGLNERFKELCSYLERPKSFAFQPPQSLRDSSPILDLGSIFTNPPPQVGALGENLSATTTRWPPAARLYSHILVTYRSPPVVRLHTAILGGSPQVGSLPLITHLKSSFFLLILL